MQPGAAPHVVGPREALALRPVGYATAARLLPGRAAPAGGDYLRIRPG
jgi:hypothetical protein